MNGKLTGREVKAAWARSSTWGVPASVTRQLYLEDTSGLDTVVGMVDDEAFNNQFLIAAEAGDQNAISKDIPMQLRYETVDSWLATAMGSAATPAVVSSQAAGSLVAYSHVVTLADELVFFQTLAIDEQQYTLEIPTMKITGFTIKVGANGRMIVDFSVVGAKANYDSTVNTNSTVAGATAAVLGQRCFRKDGVWRQNQQGAAALAGGDTVANIIDITFSTKQQTSDGDFPFGQDYILEPDNNGFPEFPINVTYGRMNTVSANSMAVGHKAGQVFKADWTFTGPFINSTTRRSMTFRFPALQVYNFAAPVVGANQVKPTVTYRAKMAVTSPSGMALVRPFDLTLVNANSANLLA